MLGLNHLGNDNKPSGFSLSPLECIHSKHLDTEWTSFLIGGTTNKVKGAVDIILEFFDFFNHQIIIILFLALRIGH